MGQQSPHPGERGSNNLSSKILRPFKFTTIVVNFDDWGKCAAQSRQLAKTARKLPNHASASKADLISLGCRHPTRVAGDGESGAVLKCVVAYDDVGGEAVDDVYSHRDRGVGLLGEGDLGFSCDCEAAAAGPAEVGSRSRMSVAM